jgi:hypothetical protein
VGLAKGDESSDIDSIVQEALQFGEAAPGQAAAARSASRLREKSERLYTRKVTYRQYVVVDADDKGHHDSRFWERELSMTSPTEAPAKSPTQAPAKSPTQAPAKSPTKGPTIAPTRFPTTVPKKTPTRFPTNVPRRAPTRLPTKACRKGMKGMNRCMMMMM